MNGWPISWDYRLDPPPDDDQRDDDDYEQWVEEHSDITVRGSLDPNDFVIPTSAAAWEILYERDFAEPEGWDQDWRDIA